MVDNIRKHPLALFLVFLASAYHVDASDGTPTYLAAAAASTSSSSGGGGHSVGFIVQACLIPVLVLLSGTLAGLTLGYMSLDETQLRVLAVSGTPKQREYALKIEPIRKNGHLLLTTLLLGNMVVNETLPVISENVLGGGIQAVVVSTVLIVVFAEIIPQSLCSRYGLQIGAYMATPTRFLIYSVIWIAWPIAKLLEFVLGPHHGIVYRRDELKELINIHSAVSAHGGDLQMDTVTIVGGALDFQEKKVMDAMTPIDNVFMLSIESRLDYETLARVVRSGHSRVPVYEESAMPNGHISKKIIGVLLVKQCVLLDPEDATPLRDIPLNTIPTIPFDEPLHSTLDRFQQGNSHMAVVSRIPSRTESKMKPGSVYDEAKVGLTRRFLNRVLGDSDSDSSASESDDEEGHGKIHNALHRHQFKKRPSRSRKKSNESNTSKKSSSNGSTKASTKEAAKKEKAAKDLEAQAEAEAEKAKKPSKSRDQSPAANWMQWNRMNQLEQTMPADAILSTGNAEEFLAGLERAPLGIITLEDVLEELIGEEILDEFDLKGTNALPASSYVPPEAQRAVDAANARNKAKASKAKGDKEKGDPLGVTPANAATLAPGSTGTPNASSTNLRLAQGLRAIRLKAGGGGGSPAPSVAGVPAAGGTAAPPTCAPGGVGGKRAGAPSPLSVPPVTAVAGGEVVKPEPVYAAGLNPQPKSTGMSETKSSAAAAAAATVPLPPSAPGSAKSPPIPLPSLPMPAPPNFSDPKSPTPPPPAPGTGAGGEIPMVRGGSRGAKKRAFKSPIAGEGATPGLEKRGDPLGGRAASVQPLSKLQQPGGGAGGGGENVGEGGNKDKPRETGPGDEGGVE